MDFREVDVDADQLFPKSAIQIQCTEHRSRTNIFFDFTDTISLAIGALPAKSNPEKTEAYYI